MGRYGKAVFDHLLSVDRAAMSTAARRESRRHERRQRARVLRLALPRVLYVLSPPYNPRKPRVPRAPRGAAELLNGIRPAA
jgi:hypothetical protein